jgi:transposase
MSVFIQVRGKYGILGSSAGETMAVEGSTDREVFDAYVEHVLAPTLEAGHVVIMDNLSAHKPAKVRELIESRSCLPELGLMPYSSASSALRASARCVASSIRASSRSLCTATP